MQRFIIEFDLGYKISTVRIRTWNKLTATENCWDPPPHQFTFHHTLQIKPKEPYQMSSSKLPPSKHN